MIMKIINLLVCVVISIFAAIMTGVTLHDLGFGFISPLVSFLIGFFMPSVLFKWLYKEEIEESKSQQNGE